MISSNPIPQVCNYGSSATYKQLPSEEQIRNGVVPLDSLPAAWWNCLWFDTNRAVNCARYAAGVLIDEVNTVLTQAGVCVNPACVDQLYRAINTIRQTIGTAAVAGAVKSSSTASEVAIDPATGIMSVNCLGNAASLTTTASTVVGAINELKSTYDTCWSNNTTALSGKAPTNHASSANTYGVGSASNYGHLKISDTYTSVLSACSGVAASQCALACVYAVASAAAAGNISLGNTNGCALGTASAGTATTAARSDHVHPMPRTDQILDAATSHVVANAVCRKVIANNMICNVGYITRVAIGLQRGTSGWGTALFSVGTDDAGTTFYDYKFSNAGLLTAACFCGALCGTATKAINADYACCAGRDGSGTAFGTAATVNTGTAANCIPLIGTALGTTNNNIVVTDASGKLKPSGTTLGSAAGCAASAFRSNTWYPDSFTSGCVRCSCRACVSGCSSCALYHTLKGKWCCMCSPGSGVTCMRVYVCFGATGDYMIFPGARFTYIPWGSTTEVPVPAMLASITDANTWVAVGSIYKIKDYCVFPACTTTGDIPSIEVW